MKAQLLLEQNTVKILTTHYEDLQRAQEHLSTSSSQLQATIQRLRGDLDRVSGPVGAGVAIEVDAVHT